MSRFWSPVVHTLTPYTPGEQPKHARLVKLNTNESPYGPSPRVLEALQRCADQQLRLYPDPGALVLRQAVGRLVDVPAEWVFVGNGSDEVLAHAFQALLRHEQPLLMPDISYSFYPVYCQLFSITAQPVPLDEQLRLRPEDYDQPCGAIIFPNPNAPTGRALAAQEVEAIIAAHPEQPVVVDEAYIEFGAQSAVALTRRYPNLLVIRTLSKAYGLAGLRVGYAIGQPDLIQALDRVKDSFNSYPLDRLALAGAVAALEDQEWLARCVHKTIACRRTLTAELEAMGFEVLPSEANFIFARHPGHAGAALYAALRERGVIVRHFDAPRISAFLRITIGTAEECSLLTGALREILSL